jgi:hypothetical protein
VRSNSLKQARACSSQYFCTCVGVLLVYKRPVLANEPTLKYVIYLQKSAFSEWAMLGSNQRPLPCEGSEIVCWGFL